MIFGTTYEISNILSAGTGLICSHSTRTIMTDCQLTRGIFESSIDVYFIITYNYSSVSDFTKSSFTRIQLLIGWLLFDRNFIDNFNNLIVFFALETV